MIRVLFIFAVLGKPKVGHSGGNPKASPAWFSQRSALSADAGWAQAA